MSKEESRLLFQHSWSSWVNRSWQEALGIVSDTINPSLSGCIPVLLVVSAMKAFSQSLLVMFLFFFDVINSMELNVFGCIVVLLICGLSKRREWLMDPAS